MNLRRILAALGGLSLVAGLLLVFLTDRDTGLAIRAVGESEADGIAFSPFTGAILVTDRDLYGYLLIALAVAIGAGLFGYRLGSRRAV
jgi:hypothetical protein